MDVLVAVVVVFGAVGGSAAVCRKEVGPFGACENNRRPKYLHPHTNTIIFVRDETTHEIYQVGVDHSISHGSRWKLVVTGFPSESMMKPNRPSPAATTAHFSRTCSSDKRFASCNSNEWGSYATVA